MNRTEYVDPRDGPLLPASFAPPAPRSVPPGSGGFAFVPSAELLAQANVTAFMRIQGIADYPTLIARSATQPDWFWAEVERFLGLRWMHRYHQVVDISRGLPWAQWFVGGVINIADNCLDRHLAQGKGDRIAIIFEDEAGAIERWSYAQLAQQSGQLAHLLKELGVGSGDAVGVFLPMVPQAVVALLAIARIGAIFVPIFSGYGEDAVAVRLADADVRVLLTCDGYLRKGKAVAIKEVADAATRNAPTVRHRIVLSHARLREDVPWDDQIDLWWDDALLGRPSDVPCAQTSSEHPFMIIYTSGTTGKPKGAVHVHGGFLVKIAQEVAFQTDLKEGEIIHWVSDMGWIMGPWLVVGSLANGGTIFLYDGAPTHPDPGRLWRMVSAHRVAILGVSPTLIRSLMPSGDAPLAGVDLSGLRILASTGEPWNPAPWRWLLDKVGQGRCPIINLSGGTEVGACFLSPTPVLPLDPCSLGGPALGMCIDVVDEECHPVRGKVGELVARFPWPGMTRGLWRARDRYLETYWSRWPAVWYHGDWASIDEHGFWYLHGRSDDTIKVAGKRLGPAEVESILANHPAVAESAVVGLPDPLKGQSIACVVQLVPLRQGSPQLATELADLVADELGKAFRPAVIHFVPDLPRTRSAKIVRRLVATVLQGGALGDISAVGNPEALEALRRLAH